MMGSTDPSHVLHACADRKLNDLTQFRSRHFFRLEIVDENLGYKLSNIIFSGSNEELTKTENTQPSLMAVSMAIIKVLENDFGKKFTLPNEDLISYKLSDYDVQLQEDTLHIMQINEKNQPAFSSRYSEKNLVPFVYNDTYKNSSNPIYNFDQMGSWSIHFDAKLLAKLLEEIGLTRGINNIFGTVKDKFGVTWQIYYGHK